MKENKISIEIERPLHEVFLFTISPENTPIWIKGIQKEEVNEWPIQIGSTYKNVNQQGKWAEYKRYSGK